MTEGKLTKRMMKELGEANRLAEEVTAAGGRAEAANILETVRLLHDGKLGAHVLWTMICRTAAGEDYVAVMKDMGWTDSVQAGKDAQAADRLSLRLRELHRCLETIAETKCSHCGAHQLAKWELDRYPGDPYWLRLEKITAQIHAIDCALARLRKEVGE